MKSLYFNDYTQCETMPNLTKIKLLTCILTLQSAMSNAQTCNTDTILATTPTSQFTDNANGTITDKKTRLIWKRCSEGQFWNSIMLNCDGTAAGYNWQASLTQAQVVNGSGGFAGLTDWRLPNSKELSSIVEEQCDSPAINLIVFPNTSGVAFWSSSSYVNDANDVWFVVFDRGDEYAGNKIRSNQVRLVRNDH